MATYSVNTNPLRERAIQWVARRRGVTPEQVVQVLLNESVDVLVRERRDVVGATLLDAYDAATQLDRTAARTAIGWNEP